jgi:hypothetical protein
MTRTAAPCAIGPVAIDPRVTAGATKVAEIAVVGLDPAKTVFQGHRASAERDASAPMATHYVFEPTFCNLILPRRSGRGQAAMRSMSAGER